MVAIADGLSELVLDDPGDIEQLFARHAADETELELALAPVEGRKIALLGRTSAATLARDVMTTSVRFVRPEQTSEQCMQIMSTGRLRHLPVVDDNGKLVGMVSIGDLVKDIISEQKFIIEQLEQYITGNH